MAIEPLILVNGTTADANQVMALFNEIYSNIDESNVQASNKTGSGKFVLQASSTLTSPTLTSPTLTSPTISGTVAGGAIYTSPTISGGIFTGNSTFDTNTLFVDSVNHRVLVGSTTTPYPQQLQNVRSLVGGDSATITANLDNTNGSSNASNTISVMGASAGDPGLFFDISGVSDWYVGVDNSDSDKFEIGLGGTVGTTPLFVATRTGLIGLGTSNPQYPLHIFHATNPTLTLDASSNVSTPTLEFRNDTGLAAAIIAYASAAGGGHANQLYIQQANNAPIVFNVAGGEHISFNPAGQIVNNISTGTAPLVVSSTTKVTNLNADLLDGLDSTAFLLNYTINSFKTDNINTDRNTLGFVFDGGFVDVKTYNINLATGTWLVTFQFSHLIQFNNADAEIESYIKIRDSTEGNDISTNLSGVSFVGIGANIAAHQSCVTLVGVMVVAAAGVHAIKLQKKNVSIAAASQNDLCTMSYSFNKIGN